MQLSPISVKSVRHFWVVGEIYLHLRTFCQHFTDISNQDCMKGSYTMEVKIHYPTNPHLSEYLSYLSLGYTYKNMFLF